MIEEDSLAAAHASNNTASFKNRLWRYGPLIIWAALIFIGSSDLLAASQTSGFLIRPLHALFPSATEGTLNAIHFSLRKLGHFTEYAILAWLAARALRTSSVQWLRERWFLVSLLFVIAYALSDEFHQSFVVTRTASIYDSMIDSAGGLVALVIVRVRTASGSDRIKQSS